MKQHTFITGLMALLISVGAIGETCAGHIEVSYSVSGSPGNYELDFSVTNNMLAWPTQNIYFFAVQLSVDNITGSPLTFANNAPADWNPFGFGGTNTNYNNTWSGFVAPYTNFLPGMTLSGFTVAIPDLVAPTEVPWSALSISPGRVDLYTGGENFNPPGIQGQENPGFEGIATPSNTSAVPEPSSLVMALSLCCLSGIGWLCHRRSQSLSAV